MSTLMELLAMIRGGPRVGLGTRQSAAAAPVSAPLGVGAENWATYTPEELKAWEDFEIRHGVRPRRYGEGRILPAAPPSPEANLMELLLAAKPGPMPPPRMGQHGIIPVSPAREEIEAYRRTRQSAR